jgi:hypothetical protein
LSTNKKWQRKFPNLAAGTPSVSSPVPNQLRAAQAAAI